MVATASAGAGLSSDTFTSLRLTNGIYLGAMGHLQVRVGDSNTMTYADHVAQHVHGYRGLHRQSAAERVATIAGYAGVPAADLNLDPGASTPMQAARLAGANPGENLRKAATTEGGSLVVDPDGLFTLVPRQQRYGQAAAMSIPHGWLTLGIKYRPDQPINDVTVTLTGGGSTRRYDQDSIDENLLRAVPFEVDSAVTADPGNLAAWTMRAYADGRVRCPALRINMRPRTSTERKQLLALRVGDRITITDRPITDPADASDLIIQGIKHTITADERFIDFNTSPMLGPSPGVPPVCAKVGSAVVGATTVIAY